jgi:flagellar hook assembly protein FlgD
MLGQKVRTLVEKKQSAGVYSQQWDGADDSGKPLAGGIYFCKLQVADQSSAKKMTLLK